MTMESILAVHIFTTLYMTGLIWFVQIVHYPLLSSVGEQSFCRYEHRHTQRATYVVALPMVLELITGILLMMDHSLNLDRTGLWIGMVLLIVNWFSTGFIQAPYHNRLLQGYDVHAQRMLVHSNWIRTIAWSWRSVVVLSFIKF